MIPSNGTVIYDRWIPLGAGIMIFIFFGFGKEAVEMYRAGLLAVGLGKLFPSLQPGRRSSIAATISTINSKAKMLFKRSSSGSDSTFTADSTISPTTSANDPVSPKAHAVLETIRELPLGGEHDSKTNRTPSKLSPISRIATILGLKT